MKSKKMIQFESEWNNIQLMKIFEEEVIDIRTNETDYIIFDMFIKGNSFIAQHIGLTEKQEKSKKIAFCKVTIDPDFSIDENLQNLYSECLQSIINSDFYQLPE